MAKDLEIRYRFEQTGRPRRNAVSAGSEVRAPLPRITRLMALAVRLDATLRNGCELDREMLARMGHVSRSRVTQILNLLHLAPDIQERLLNMAPLARGREPITEKSIRQLAGDYDWQRQRDRFESILAHRADRSKST